MKLIKLLSPIVATTIAISTLTFLSIDSAMAVRVRVVRNCITYNNAGRPVGTLKRGLYPLVGYMKFARSRYNGARVRADFTSSGKGVGTVNIANRCLQNSGGRVVEFN
ncbi:hypothetical protein [Nostoc sp. UHCC 0252]|uniref:hypothetical protein n=1 Tax=Nostoc sp. UHCC 0252 TaxID=3110241 RepID=UPI002B200A06|nr:hypothetical protein [Nostoc sp. UHCC 0252]MEA5606190.1 hypothetical protein [Nostoc sp. UHCC 0252]